MTPEADFVTLKNGPTLPVASVLLALDLESRGVRLKADGDTLVVSPRERITAEDRALIRRWKPHLLALLAYDASEVQ
jgi:hypothetical protein